MRDLRELIDSETRTEIDRAHARAQVLAVAECIVEVETHPTTGRRVWADGGELIKKLRMAVDDLYARYEGAELQHKRLYVLAGADEYRVGSDGSVSSTASLAVS